MNATDAQVQVERLWSFRKSLLPSGLRDATETGAQRSPLVICGFAGWQPDQFGRIWFALHPADRTLFGARNLQAKCKEPASREAC
jgi:hypothetical protein